MLFFSKYQGLGNDFVLIEDFQDNIFLSEKEIIKLCHRNLGIGADGLIILKKSKTADFAMSILNSDGKKASFCGNAVFCILAFLKEKAKDFINLQTDAGVIETGYDKELFYFVAKYEIVKKKVIIDKRDFFWVNTGVDHAVCFVENFDFDLEKIGRKVRFAKEFLPNGVNVDFVKIEKDHIFVRTYEKGVEKETKSCGSGALASALYFFETKKSSFLPIRFKLGTMYVAKKDKLKLYSKATYVFSGSIKL